MLNVLLESGHTYSDPNLSSTHGERTHKSASPVSWTAHRQGCSTRSVPLLFLASTLHSYDNHRRIHWHGPRRWSSGFGDPSRRKSHTASSSQINLITRLLSDILSSHAPPFPFDYDCMTAGNTYGTQLGLPSNAYTSCTQHDSNLTVLSLYFNCSS